MIKGRKFIFSVFIQAMLMVIVLQYRVAAIIPIDTIKIPEVTIYDTRPYYQQQLSDNRDTAEISTLQYRDFGQILRSRSPINIRSYGPGLIYSLSSRGSNTAQISLLWNDILINHPLPGMADLSMLKSGGLENIRFNPLGSQSGIGGTIELNDHFLHDSGTLAFSGVAHSTIGYNADVRASCSGNKHHLQGFFSTEENRNAYRFLKDNQMVTQEHATSRFTQFKTGYLYEINRRSQIGTHIWMTGSHREIPASLYEKFSDATQTDEAARIMVFYHLQLKNAVLKIQSAFIRDLLHYDSPNKSISTQSTGYKLVQQIHFSNQLSGTSSLFVKLENEQLIAKSTAYPDPPSFNQTLLKTFVTTRIGTRFKLTGGFNSGMRDQQLVPFSPFIQTGLELGPKIEIVLSAGRNFRYPGFNDYYWPVGGNPDLKPETATEADLGFILKKYRHFNAGAHVYLKRTRNWIIWLPKQGLFYAQNMENVQSLGLEANLGYARSNPKTAFSTELMYHFNRNYSLTNNPARYQMIYTPEHTIKHWAKLGYRSNSLTVFHAWTSRVYTSTDNAYFLKPYYLVDLSFDRLFKLGPWYARWFVSANNLFNTNYQTIENYPMPGIHLSAGLKTEWISNNK